MDEPVLRLETSMNKYLKSPNAVALISLVSISFQLYIQVNHICGCILRADWLISLYCLCRLYVEYIQHVIFFEA